MRIQLIRAWPHRYDSVEIELAAGARVGDALAAAGWALDSDFSALAVFGQPASADTALHAGDRIELLRGLQIDPMSARRKRARKP